MCTVGYGDLVPAHGRGKLFTIFFTLYGCYTVGTAVRRVTLYAVEKHKRAQHQMESALGALAEGVVHEAGELSDGLGGDEAALLVANSKSLQMRFFRCIPGPIKRVLFGTQGVLKFQLWCKMGKCCFPFVLPFLMAMLMGILEGTRVLVGMIGSSQRSTTTTPSAFGA